MDTYQAVYDAVRSRIGNCDVSSAVESAARDGLDFGHAKALAQEAYSIASYEMSRPSVLYRPAISIDGNKWCALYGENLQDGVAGFGGSPAEAMADFDRAWVKHLGAALAQSTKGES